MTDLTRICCVALLLGLILLGLAGLQLWLKEAIVPIRKTCVVHREDSPFWFWSVIGLYIIVGILFIYGGIDGLIHGPV
jgi:hypothetical protein